MIYMISNKLLKIKNIKKIGHLKYQLVKYSTKKHFQINLMIIQFKSLRFQNLRILMILMIMIIKIHVEFILLIGLVNKIIKIKIKKKKN